MDSLNVIKYTNKGKDLHLRVAGGHFATNNSHTNYYIDMTTQKSRHAEAKAAAEELRNYFYANTIIDTILCLDGTEVIGTCLADSLTKADFINMNAHKSIYIVTPEQVNGGQFLFRDNLVPMIKDKHIMVLAMSVTSGKTVSTALDAVKYYGGIVSGIASVFSFVEECEGYPVRSVFNFKDLPDYKSYAPHECPMCKAGKKLDAFVSSHGFSKI